MPERRVRVSARKWVNQRGSGGEEREKGKKRKRLPQFSFLGLS
jgi:hypothetical protein